MYNFTLSNHFLLFNIQQDNQISRSYRLLRRYDHDSCLPNSLELSTPTTNYTLLIKRSTSSNISMNFLKNNRSISHGLGVYKEDSINQCSIDLNEIHPQHIGTVVVRLTTETFTIDARKLLGGELRIEIDRWSTWKSLRLRIDSQRTFFFFQQNFSAQLSIDLNRSSYNFSFLRNENDRFQWHWMKNTTHFSHLFLLNTTYLDFYHQTQVIALN